jgi:hypothetical protein
MMGQDTNCGFLRLQQAFISRRSCAKLMGVFSSMCPRYGLKQTSTCHHLRVKPLLQGSLLTMALWCAFKTGNMATEVEEAGTQWHLPLLSMRMHGEKHCASSSPACSLALGTHCSWLALNKRDILIEGLRGSVQASVAPSVRPSASEADWTTGQNLLRSSIRSVPIPLPAIDRLWLGAQTYDRSFSYKTTILPSVTQPAAAEQDVVAGTALDTRCMDLPLCATQLAKH